VKLAEAKQKEAQLLLPTYDRVPLLLERGKGVYLYDSEGRKYLDFITGIGVNALGYGDPAVLKTIAKQSARLIHSSNLFYHEFTTQLAERLTRISGLDRVFLSNSGTEAWEGALKIARAYAKKTAAAELSRSGASSPWKTPSMAERMGRSRPPARQSIARCMRRFFLELNL